jgi:acyl dehydratase
LDDNPFAALRLGQRIVATRTITADEIRATADLIGDDHFLHHDADRAAGTRFGGLIASGGHTCGLIGSVVARHFDGQSLGLDLSCQFRGAVHAGDTLTIEWVVTDLQAKNRWRGGVATLDGQAINQRGEVVATGRITVLVSPMAIAGDRE